MAGERWLFTQEQLANTPSRQCGIDAEKEKCYRQQAANFMQEMGQRLTVSQLCINTGIVYLHRFYMFQSFTKFHRNSMAQACLFLAAKVEEQPRKLEHVIKVAHMILHRDQPPLDTKSVAYLDQAQELVINENILLQTLGFELQVDHPHAHIVKTCNLIKAPKDLTQTSYFLATNSLHLTLMSLRYKPTFVACVCIHLACKWAKFRIPISSAGKEWWYYVDKDMTAETLEEITQSFLAVLDKCPNKFKKKLVSKSAKDEDFISLMQFPQEKKPRSEATATVTKDASAPSVSPSTSQTAVNHESSPQTTIAKNSPPTSKPETSISKPQPVAPNDGTMRRVKTESYLTSLTMKEYFERKERERKERERIEKERQKLVERKESSQQQREHEQQNIQAASEKSEIRQHANIFDQIISEKQKNETPMDTIDSGLAPRAKHSLERSHAHHNYKERYHHKERTDKLPFSPDIPKEQAKAGSHRPLPNQRPNPINVGHQSRDLKQKGRGYDRRYTEPRQHSVSGKEHQKLDMLKSSAQETKLKTPVQESLHLVTEASPEKAPVEVKVQKLDPEEGEILDDDSPLGSQIQKRDKSVSQHDGERGYPHYHRERRLSGRHQSPAAAGTAAVAAAAPLPTSGHAKVPGPEGRMRHRSPRSAHPPVKEESQQQARDSKPVAPQIYEVTVPEPTAKLPDIGSLHSKALEEVPFLKQATPEPGEIVEHGQKHHHKSSRSKGHKKDKHRDRESSHDSGSLKIKLDLKGMGAVASSTKPPSSSLGDDRKKEIKLKIKPPVMGVAENKEPLDSAAGLKVKLKVPTVLSPVKGNGEASKSEAKDHHKSANAIKLTLSKDSQSGQFTAHGGSHKSHRHSSASEKGTSRKRPFSPSEVPAAHHKLARNDSGISERHQGNELPTSLHSDNATSSPLATAGSLVHPALVEDVQRQLHRLIEKKTEEIQQQKLVSGKKPHHDNLNNPNAAFPPTEPSHTLPHS